jgi:hypothetical protein
MLLDKSSHPVLRGDYGCEKKMKKITPTDDPGIGMSRSEDTVGAAMANRRQCIEQNESYSK